MHLYTRRLRSRTTAHPAQTAALRRIAATAKETAPASKPIPIAFCLRPSRTPDAARRRRITRAVGWPIRGLVPPHQRPGRIHRAPQAAGAPALRSHHLLHKRASVCLSGEDCRNRQDFAGSTRCTRQDFHADASEGKRRTYGQPSRDKPGERHQAGSAQGGLRTLLPGGCLPRTDS